MQSSCQTEDPGDGAQFWGFWGRSTVFLNEINGLHGDGAENKGKAEKDNAI